MAASIMDEERVRVRARRQAQRLKCWLVCGFRPQQTKFHILGAVVLGHCSLVDVGAEDGVRQMRLLQ